MTDRSRPTDAEDVFGDTCVLFDYAVEGRSAARTLFEDRGDVEKVVSPRIKREFESVATRQQDIHRELLEFATSGQLDQYEPEAVGTQRNDLRYSIELYSELTALEDEIEVARRLNELVNRLEKASEELFCEGGYVTIVDVDGLDVRLKGLLSGVVSNDADVRVLCDAVAWRRDGGSGAFLTEDTEDLLGRNDGQTESGPTRDTESDEDETQGLPDSFEDFFVVVGKSLPERINEQIAQRYDSTSTLNILSVREFLEEKIPLEEPSE